jgi:hypothetical protein
MIASQLIDFTRFPSRTSFPRIQALNQQDRNSDPSQENLMSTATPTLNETAPSSTVDGCGSCTYVYSSVDHCYHRKTKGCTGDCNCPPQICGLASDALQIAYPASVLAAQAVPVPCTSSGTTAEEEKGQIILGALEALDDSLVFWRRLAIGMGVLCALMASGLAYTLLR